MLNSPYSKKFTQDEFYTLHKKNPQLRTSSQLPTRGGPFYAMDEPGWAENNNLDNVRLSVEHPWKGKNVWSKP